MQDATIPKNLRHQYGKKKKQSTRSSLGNSSLLGGSCFTFPSKSVHFYFLSRNLDPARAAAQITACEINWRHKQDINFYFLISISHRTCSIQLTLHDQKDQPDFYFSFIKLLFSFYVLQIKRIHLLRLISKGQCSHLGKSSRTKHS